MLKKTQKIKSDMKQKKTLFKLKSIPEKTGNGNTSKQAKREQNQTFITEQK